MKSLVLCWIYSGNEVERHSIHPSEFVMGVKRIVAVIVCGCDDSDMW